MNPKERLEDLESTVKTLQVTVAQLQIDIHMLKLINKILQEVKQ